jgi:hypothetical protein
MRAELSAASSLADERPRHKIALSNLFDAARVRIQATCELLAAPLDVILANIEREDIEEGARTTPLVGAPSLPSMVDATSRRYVLVPNLAVALVDATYLERPVLPSRCLLPPTHTKCWMGFIRQFRPRWRERVFVY